MLDFHEGLAAERSDGLPWVDLGVGAWPAERQHSMWDTKMRPWLAGCLVGWLANLLAGWLAAGTPIYV